MIRLGGIESTKEAYRDQRGLPALETLWKDVRYSLGILHKNFGFAAVAVLTLALGVLPFFGSLNGNVEVSFREGCQFVIPLCFAQR